MVKTRRYGPSPATILFRWLLFFAIVGGIAYAGYHFIWQPLQFRNTVEATILTKYQGAVITARDKLPNGPNQAAEGLTAVYKKTDFLCDVAVGALPTDVTMTCKVAPVQIPN